MGGIMKESRLSTAAARRRRGLALACVAAAAASIPFGGLVSGAGAAGANPYSLEPQALLSAAGTDLTLRLDGPTLPAALEKLQVKAWPPGAEEAETRNFFDVPAPAGVATIRLPALPRGARVEVHAHLKDGPQHVLRATAAVLRRPDL